MGNPITGILGMTVGDGAGDKIALSVNTRILQILSDTKLSYFAASVANPAEVKAGSVFYRTPDLVQTGDYEDGTTPADVMQAGGFSIDVNRRLTVKWEYETFDIERITDGDTLVAMISTGQAISIENSLNAEFLTGLVKEFETGGSLENSNQTVVLEALAKRYTRAELADLKSISDNAFIDSVMIEYAITDISTIFDKKQAGVAKDDIISFVAPLVDNNIRVAFRNQPNELGRWQISKTLSGKFIGNWKYWVDNHLMKKFVENQSFSKKSYDFSKYAGFLLHNEAVAFPMNYKNTVFVIDPVSANPRFITKVQFGFGILRPKLIYALLVPNA